MKQKKYIILSITVFVIVILINTIISLNIYKNYEKQIINELYNIDNINNLKMDVAINNSNYQKKIISYSIISTSCICIIFIVILIVYHKIQNNKIKEISNYMNKVLNEDYSLDIRSYEEGDLSILKNDIYKMTVKLKEQTDMAINEKKNLEMILSDISHQIKTPLTSMYIINDLLKENKLSKKERIEFLNKNAIQLEQIEWLVTSLLKVSRLDNGFIKLKKDYYNINKLINNCLNPLLIQMEFKNQNIIKKISDFKIYIDFNWFSEAIINILKNAYEHTDINGTIVIEAFDNPIYASIIISDNGVGISKKDLPHIFERFYKGDNQKMSIGIGLNMAKKIIDLSGGEISVESKVNKGTTFIIKIYKNII